MLIALVTFLRVCMGGRRSSSSVRLMRLSGCYAGIIVARCKVCPGAGRRLTRRRRCLLGSLAPRSYFLVVVVVIRVGVLLSCCQGRAIIHRESFPLWPCPGLPAVENLGYHV